MTNVRLGASAAGRRAGGRPAVSRLSGASARPTCGDVVGGANLWFMLAFMGRFEAMAITPQAAAR